MIVNDDLGDVVCKSVEATYEGVFHKNGIYGKSEATLIGRELSFNSSLADPLAPTFASAACEGASEGHAKQTGTVTLTGTNLRGTGSTIEFCVKASDGTVRQDWTDVGMQCDAYRTDTEIKFMGGIESCLGEGVSPAAGDSLIFKLDAGDHGEAETTLVYEVEG